MGAQQILLSQIKVNSRLLGDEIPKAVEFFLTEFQLLCSLYQFPKVDSVGLIHPTTVEFLDEI
jgi:hypothetical protein